MQQQAAPQIPQYSLGRILMIWAAAAAPMGVLEWIVTPALTRGSTSPGFIHVAVLTVGLVWQFVLVLIMLRRETGKLSWSSAA